MAKTTSTAAALPQIKPPRLRTFHAALAAWYQAHGRHALPWRKTDDPYHIWLSEVMLQQTQVSTVLARFYYPFLERFPTIQALAVAPREAVMKAWEGLGYYRRAGFLHEAAKRAHNGLPTDIEGLRALPGIGRNTAHAIAAFAYHQPVAILEANVKRIVARIFAWESPSEQQLWAGAETLLNHAEPFDYNQAMMDLGSLICTPKNPDCPACPANKICLGQSSPESYPAPRARKHVPTREVIIEVTQDAVGKFYLEARDAALLGGLYGFPQFPISHAIQNTKPLGQVVQIYSHFRLQGQVMLRTLTAAKYGTHWHTRKEISALPLSGVDHKVLALIDISHTAQKKLVKRPSRRTKR